MRFWIIILTVSINLITTASFGQWLYLLGHKSTSRYLQRINTSTLEVVDVVRIPLPELTDIVFHPDGTLYCVEFSSFSILDTITGLTTLIKDFTGFEAVGLAVDYNGIFYFSGIYTATQEFAVIRYNKDTDEIKKLASFSTYNFTHLDDLDFYNGALYAVGLLPPTFGERQALFKVDTVTQINHDTITTYELGQSAAIGSFNDSCSSLNLVAISSGQLQFFYPDFDSVKFVEVLTPPNFRSGGATTKSGWMGSIPPLKINDILISHNPCASEELAEVIVNADKHRKLSVMYSLNGVSYQDSNNFNDVLPGKYQAFLQDEWGCKFISDTFLIIEATGFNYNLEITPTFCNLNNGKLNVSSENDSDSLLFSIDKTNFYSDTTFGALNPGPLTLYIVNTDGCLDSIIVFINEIEAPIVTLQSTPETCDQGNGIINTAVNFGTPPYSFYLNGILQSNGDFQDLNAGLYDVLVIDNLGCEALQQITVNGILAPVLNNVSVSPASCGLSDGSIEVFAISDTSYLFYSINQGNYLPSNLFTDLTSGTYSLSIIDTFGCSVSAEVIINDTSTVSISSVALIPATCGLNNGQLTIETNSIGSFQYSLNNGIAQSSPIFNDLSPGIYLATVFAISGCTDTMSVEVDQNPEIEIQNLSVSNASCNLNNGRIVVHAVGSGLLFSINGNQFQSDSTFLDLPEGIYSIMVADPQGCSDTINTSLIQNGSPVIENVVTLPEHCDKADGSLIVENANSEAFPLQYSINNSAFQDSPGFQNLVADTYTVVLIDANGCSDTAQAIIPEETGPVVNSKQSAPEICDSENGSIQITASSLYPLTYSLEGNTKDIGQFTDLSSGIYSILIEDPYGCLINEDVFVSDSLTLKIDEILISESVCNGLTGSIEIKTEGNIETKITEFPGQIWENTINELGRGTYNLEITDLNGCSLDTIVIIPESCHLYLPNIFSPNGDNFNDMFGVTDEPSITSWNLQIFDRSGNMVFYTYDPLNGWNGNVRERPAQVGVYAWVLKYRLNDNGIENFRRGDLTLIR